MSFHDTMLTDHERIMDKLRAMIECAYHDDREEVALKWDAFEVMLLGHMDFEEMFLLPGLERHDAHASKRIRDEHAAIRDLLARIGLGLDLHMVRDEDMRALADRLDAHAKMEEVHFYRWADETLPQSTLKSLRRRLGARRAA